MIGKMFFMLLPSQDLPSLMGSKIEFLQTHLSHCNEVTEDSQLLVFKRYNHWWRLNARRMKATLRARLRWSDEVWNRGVDQACITTWVISESTKDPNASMLQNYVGCLWDSCFELLFLVL